MVRFALIGLEFDAAARQLGPWSAGFAWALASNPARAQAVGDGIVWAQTQQANVVVFSGFTQQGTLASPGTAPIVGQLRAAGLVGVFELVEKGASKHSGPRAYFTVDPAANVISRPFVQSITTSKGATPGRVSALTQQLAPNGARRMLMAGVDVALIICGEDNILYQPRGGVVQDRYPQTAPVPRNYQVLLDPRHTVSRRYELRSRVEYFSSGAPNRFASAHANYGPGQADAAYLVWVARNGQLVVDGGADPNVYQGNGFYGVTFDVP